MARRQLSRRGRAAARDPGRPAARVLSGAAQAGRGTARRLSTRLRNRLGVRRAYRQPVRSRIAPAVRARLPARAATDHGELWAVAITLRIVLVENLRRLAESIVRGRAARQEADALADELLGIGDGPVAPTVKGLARFEGGALVTAFAVQLVQRLREQDRAVTPALRWLDERLEAQGTTSEDIVRVEHQRQAAMNVTVRNVIMSMSLMSALDRAEFFET